MKLFFIFICCTILAASAQDEIICTAATNLTVKDHGANKVEEPCICPADPIHETDSCVMGAMKKRFITNIWTNEKAVFDPEQLAMRDIVFKMINTEYPLWHHAAFVNNAWMSTYLHNADEAPSLCAFAQIINATVHWETNQNQRAISDALAEISLSLHNYVQASGDASLRAAGCPVVTPRKLKTHDCHENGLTYNIDEVWDVSGGLMPSAYEKAAKALYKSTSYQSRLMAIMATASITESMQHFANNFEGELVAQFLHLAKTTPIPKCCCPNFAESLHKSYEHYRVEAHKVSTDIKTRLISTLKHNNFNDYLPPALH